MSLARRSILSVFSAFLAIAALNAPAVASHQEGGNDVSVSQIDNPDPVIEGGFVEYALTVSNQADHPAQEVTLDHTISAGTTVSATGTKWECAIVTILNKTSCFLHGSLPSGQSADVLRVVVQAPTLDTASSITSTASVASRGTESHPENNQSVEVTTLEEGDDLAVSQFDEPFEVTSAHAVRYVISVANHGNTTASGVTLTEEVVGGTVEGAGGDGWTCSTTASSAACTVDGSLSPSQIAPDVSVLVRAPNTTADTTITATATAASTRLDRDTSDNTAVETTEVAGSGQDRATGYIAPTGGFITTNPSGQITEPPAGASAFAAAASAVPASPTDATIGDAIFPAGPGGVASLFEGPSTSQLAVCAVPVVNCAGAALDVIVPPGYNDPNDPILVNLIYDASVAPASEGNRRVFVEKPVNGVPTTLPLPDCQLLGIANPSPCVDFQTRLADGDLLIRILMLSQDPKYQG